jgi:hypothetical protein
MADVTSQGVLSAVARKNASAGGYLIDEDFDDNLLPSGWTATGTYSITGGILEGINGADYVTFDVPAAMQDEFWFKTNYQWTGSFSKSSYGDVFEILDSGGLEFIEFRQYGTTSGYHRLEATSTTDSLCLSTGVARNLWFHFVKNGTSEVWVSSSSTRPTTDSSTECVISLSTPNTSASKIKLKLGWSNGTRPAKWDFFIGDDAEVL